MKETISVLTLGAMLVALCLPAEAQRPAQGGGSLRKLANVHKVQYYEHRSSRGGRHENFIVAP
jgi:hypothetical protein